MLTWSVPYSNEVAQHHFASPGEKAVPIVTQKLLQSLAEKVSVEAAREDTLMKMTAADAERVEYQFGLICINGVSAELHQRGQC